MMMNLIERALWTGLQTGLALVGADALLDSFAVPTRDKLMVALVASGLSALKTFSLSRLEQLGGEDV